MDAIIESVWENERDSKYLKQAAHLLEIFTADDMPFGTLSFLIHHSNQQIPESIDQDNDLFACYAYIKAETIGSNKLFQDLNFYMQQIKRTADNMKFMDLVNPSAYSKFSHALDLINHSRRLLHSDEAEEDIGDIANRCYDLEEQALSLVENVLSNISIAEAYLLKSFLIEKFVHPDYETQSIECYDKCLSIVPADSLLDFLARTRKINLLLCGEDQDHICLGREIDQLIINHPLNKKGYELKAQLNDICEDYEGAATSLNRTLDLDLNSLGTHLQLARLLMNKGNFDEALSEVEKAIALNPAIVSSYIAKGNILISTGDYEKASDLVDTFLNQKENLERINFTGFYFLKSKLFYIQGKFEEAVKTLDEGLEVSNDLFEEDQTIHFLGEKIRLHLSLFYCLKEQGKISEARDLLNKTEEIAKSGVTLYSCYPFDSLRYFLDSIPQDE